MTIIAEIGTSHGGDIKKAYSMIDEAKNAGASCVKFQWVYADEILHPDTGFVKLPTGNIRLYDRFRSLETESDFYRQCKDYAHSRGLLFSCSPFGLRSLDNLINIGCDAIKIASPEVNHYPMLNKIKEYYGKIPVILSSGVSKLGDIEKAIEILKSANPSINPFDTLDNGLPALTLLHCITFYPAPEEEYNVRCLKTLREVFGVPTGISDHSLDPILVPVLSTLMGGTMIEKHITLSKETDGLDDPVALEEEQFALMCHCVNQTKALIHRYQNDENAVTGSLSYTCDKFNVPKRAFDDAIKQLEESFSPNRINKVLGSGIKKLSQSESVNYGRTNRSLHYTRSLSKGTTVTQDDIAVLRTEKVLSPGISPEYFNMIKGLILTKDVSSGQGVKITDFTERDPRYI